jgi:hypothetical protein
MDALVQLYGPFDLDNDLLPHFDTNGEPVPGDNQTHLSSQLQIASSEGCCKREGSGIGSLVTPGRYVVLIFHCSIGPNENRPYKVTYTLNKKARIPFISLGTMQLANPSLYSRAVNVLYRVVDPEQGNLVTQLGQVYKVSVRTEDAATQGQLRIAVFTYAYKKVPMDQDEVPPVDEHHYVLYDNAYWGRDVVTFEPYEDQVRALDAGCHYSRGLKASLPGHIHSRQHSQRASEYEDQDRHPARCVEGEKALNERQA